MLKYEKWSIFSGSDSCNTSAQNNNKNVQKSKNDLKEIPETNEVTPPQVYIISRLDHNSSSKRSKNTPKNYIWYVVHIIIQNITWRVNFYSSKGLIWKGGKNILGVKKRCRDLVTYAYILITYWLKMFELVFSQSTFLGTGRIPPTNTNGSFLKSTFKKPQNSSQ